MLGRLIILIAVGVGVYLLLRWFARTPPHKVARGMRQGLIYGGIGLLVVLAATGRLHWIFVALGAMVPLVQRGFMLVRFLPLVQQVLRMVGISVPGVAGAGGGSNPGGRVSTIRTRFLTMTLEHASGEMDGEIIDGPHQGTRLSQLPLETLVELVGEYRRQDQQSAAVLEAYLDRHHGQEWREDSGHEKRAGAGGQGDGGGPMSHEEALAILGLQAGADNKAIREAHRRLMQKLHPDRGGSDWLASRINLAKDTLLGN
ncbi:MAG: molecular chaperone DnaJ [Gammaproteobacteria bacterium]|nr:molecular chaperone DnaJ [Gammaproteobacteria bacterium]